MCIYRIKVSQELLHLISKQKHCWTHNSVSVVSGISVSSPRKFLICIINLTFTGSRCPKYGVIWIWEQNYWNIASVRCWCYVILFFNTVLQYCFKTYSDVFGTLWTHCNLACTSTEGLLQQHSHWIFRVTISYRWVVLCQAIDLSGHPKNYLFLSPNNVCIGFKCQKKHSI